MTIKIVSCSCFFDQCIYLTTCSNSDIYFDSITSNDRDIFIKEKRHRIFDGRISYVEYVISCFDCFAFQLWNLTIQNVQLLNTVNCRFTFSDPFNYGQEFCDDVFIGNGQFFEENELLVDQIWNNFLSSNILEHFCKQPRHKSCFASIQVCRYMYFCPECKKLYCLFFEGDLHVFWSSI